MILSASPSLARTDPSQEVKHNDYEIACLTQVIYFESRGEPIAGQLAVGLVTINRKNSNLFPNTICEVTKQKTPVCQYSWYCDGKSDTVPNNKEGKLAKALATRLLTSEVEDITKGALFFHADYINPGWTNLEKTIEIGAHVFYRRI
jgi:spore germination cell wall hydrolase CwlJ-like protein